MKTEKATTATPVVPEEASLTTLSRLIDNFPSTQVFAGWGPRLIV